MNNNPYSKYLSLKNVCSIFHTQTYIDVNGFPKLRFVCWRSPFKSFAYFSFQFSLSRINFFHNFLDIRQRQSSFNNYLHVWQLLQWFLIINFVIPINVTLVLFLEFFVLIFCCNLIIISTTLLWAETWTRVITWSWVGNGSCDIVWQITRTVKRLRNGVSSYRHL